MKFMLFYLSAWLTLVWLTFCQKATTAEAVKTKCERQGKSEPLNRFFFFFLIRRRSKKNYIKKKHQHLLPLKNESKPLKLQAFKTAEKIKKNIEKKNFFSSSSLSILSFSLTLHAATTNPHLPLGCNLHTISRKHPFALDIVLFCLCLVLQTEPCLEDPSVD